MGLQVMEIHRGNVFGWAVRDDWEDDSGITVAMIGHDEIAMTDEDGFWQINGVKPGFYNVLASFEGYYSARENGIYIGPGKTSMWALWSLRESAVNFLGRVVLEGVPDYSNVKVTLTNTPYVTYTDTEGFFGFEVPVGNYDGLTAEKLHYETGTYDETMTVTEYGNFNVPPMELAAVTNELSGYAQLAGLEQHDNILVELDGLPGSDAAGNHYETLTATDGSYYFPEVLLGPYTARYSKEGSVRYAGEIRGF